MTTHAKLSPSSSFRWLECTSSIEAINDANIKYETNSFAQEGTLAHELGELMLNSSPYNKSNYPDEMVEYCEQYKNYIDSLDCVESFVEKRVKALNSVYGTADYIGIDKENTIHVVDLKYGKGVKVSVENNTQLMIYALGAINYLKLDSTKKYKIRLHIFQPRINNICYWDFVNVKEFYLKLKNTVQDINSFNTEFKPSEKTCIFCPVAGNCNALFQYNRQKIIPLFKNESNSLNNKQIKLILDNEKLLSSMMSAIKNEAYKRIINGENINGYHLTKKLSNRKFNDKAIDILKSEVEPDIFKYLIKESLKSIGDVTRIMKNSDTKLDELKVFEEREEKIILGMTKDSEPLNLFEDIS